ncbi:hypothetical protein [Fimbriiglobus ruber]|uniref:Alkaline ceramidase domain protein n=1 Tax=Fimbriiglobus ruber TaxID=1908690 RepID=A0A225E1R8_9BACT|nr:hypothetical protein [Fimbriiglobus ruber]OWK47501.1 hypothetical protein FRUB_01200 [Fimbriiglobus ruber]
MRTLPTAVTLLLSALPSYAAEPGLSVGFASVDVSPTLGEKPVFMAGFGQNRVATKIHDPISARAVVLADGEDKIALVSIDVVGLFLPSVERVREQLTGFKFVLVSSTHNHEGPDTLGLWGRSPFQSGVDPEYLKKVVDGAAAAIKAADAARKPARAVIGSTSGDDLLRDGRLPIVKHDELVALRFDSPDGGKPLGILVQWNCHPELLSSKNTEITADYVHYTVKHLAETHQCPVAYFTGTVGGLMTSLGVEVRDAAGKVLKDGTFEKSEQYGRLVGQLADKALGSATPITLTPLSVRTKRILVPVDNVIYKLAGSSGVLNRKMYAWDGDPAVMDPVETKDTTKPVAVRTEISYLKLGALDVAVIPGEIYPELVLGKVQDPADPNADFPTAPIEPAIYAQLKSKHKMLIGLGNDQLGYFIPKRQWDEKAPFCYGLKSAQYGEINSVGPEAAPIICNTFRDLVAGK